LPFPVSTDFWSRMTDDLQEVVRRLIDVPRAPMEKGNVPLRLLQLLIASGPNAAVARINRTGLDHSAIASILSDCPLSMTSEPAVESYLEAAWIVQCAYGHARAFGWRKADTDHAMIAALEEVERQGGPLAEELSAQGLTTDRLIESPRLKPAEDAETVEAAPTEPVRASEVDVLSTRLLAMQSAALKLLTDANSAATKLDKLLKHGARETEGD